MKMCVCKFLNFKGNLEAFSEEATNYYVSIIEIGNASNYGINDHNLVKNRKNQLSGRIIFKMKAHCADFLLDSASGCTKNVNSRGIESEYWYGGE